MIQEYETQVRLGSSSSCEIREEQDLLENLDLELFGIKKSRLDLD